MSADFSRLWDLWSAHQDYFWFLALLGWAAVLALAAGRRRAVAPVPVWLLLLASAQVVGAVAELALLAQDLRAPYVAFDRWMGGATLVAACTLWLPLLPGPLAARRRISLGVVFACAASLGVVRHFQPALVGSAAGLLAAFAAWQLAHRHRETLFRWVPACVALGALIAPHGPWAHVIGRGRISRDLSEFGIAAALVSLAGGLCAALALWRTSSAAPESASTRRDLRRVAWVLGAWLVLGGAFIVWQGRVARQVFEENFLRRITTAAALMDAAAVQKCLGPNLRITATQWKRYPDGKPVLAATVPFTADDTFDILRDQLTQLARVNPDVIYFYIAAIRDGHLMVAAAAGERGTKLRTNQRGRSVVFRPATPRDLALLGSRDGFLEGPYKAGTWGEVFSAKVPLLDPVTRRPLGWLVADVTATRWTASFTQARLQGMILVGTGVVLCVLALAYRRRREESLAAARRAEAAAEADRLKSAFLAKVSHELRTPLQSLLGYGELLAQGRLPDAAQRQVRAVRDQADLMLRVVNDLIDLGAMQSGVFRLRPAPTALPELLADCANALRPAAAAKGLAITATLAPELPLWVRIDAARLRQVLLNLLGNAVKFTPRGGVWFTARVHARPSSPPALELEVLDSGPGIPAEARGQLFQPFTSLSAQAGGGAGLGLATAHALCVAMGGSVELADSAPGACFIVRLPLELCPAPLPAPAAALADTACRGLRVLVVEDNTLVRELLVSFLIEQGAEVRAAADGPSALALCAQHLPDAILLDIALPGLDGLAVTRELRALFPDSRVRIVGLSAHAQDVDATRAAAAGMDDFLSKPVRLASLAHVLRGTRVAEPPALDPAPLDASLLARLENTFRAETPLVLAELRAAIDRRDWARARARAHYLKNSADVLDLPVLGAACQRFSTTPWESVPETAHRALADLERAALARTGHSPAAN